MVYCLNKFAVLLRAKMLIWCFSCYFSVKPGSEMDHMYQFQIAIYISNLLSKIIKYMKTNYSNWKKNCIFILKCRKNKMNLFRNPLGSDPGTFILWGLLANKKLSLPSLVNTFSFLKKHHVTKSFFHMNFRKK